MHFIKYLNNLSASPLTVHAVHRARRVTVTVRRTLINRKMLTFFLWGARHYGGAVCCAATCCRNFSGSLMGQTRQAVCTIRAPAELEPKRAGGGAVALLHLHNLCSTLGELCLLHLQAISFVFSTFHSIYNIYICDMLVCRS